MLAAVVGADARIAAVLSGQRRPYRHAIVQGPALVVKRTYPQHVSRNSVRTRLAVTARATSSRELPATRMLPRISADPSPFFEPLLRSFLLGVSAGAIWETGHVALKFGQIVQQVGYQQLLEVLPKFVDRFSPLFVSDHIVALGSWVLFYTIEAVAVVAVLNRYPDDADAAAREIANLITLPRKMLPGHLESLKQLVLNAFNALPPTLQAIAAAPTDTQTSLGDEPFAEPSAFTSGPSLAPTHSGPSTDTEVRSSIVAAPPGSRLPRSEPVRPKIKPFVDSDEPPTLAERRQKAGLRPGEWDAQSSMLAHRQKELAGRRSYLKNFWYAAAISEKVAEKPVGVEIVGQKVVLFRGKDGVVHCIGDVCPHRGAPLHRGWVADVNGHDCVVCPYHGWAFDEGGVLRDVPAAEHAGEFPQKQLVDVYPVVEKGGFVWLFYGSSTLPIDERPPIPIVPELEDSTWKPVYGEIEFNCNHWSVFENAIDMAHIHYLHDDTFGNQGQPQIRKMVCSHDAYGVKADFALHNKPVNAMWEFSKVPEVQVTAQALLPSTSVIAFTLGNGLSFTTFVNTVPINEHRTVNRFALVRKLNIDKTGIFNMNAWDRFARNAMLRILSEDKAMVEELRPDLLAREISVKADLPQIAFRKLRQEYIDMGYGVTPEAAAGKIRGNADF